MAKNSGPRRSRSVRLRHLEVLRRMSAGDKLRKTFELTEMTRELFRHGLRRRFPHLSEGDFHRLFLERLDKCHNRNY